MTADSAQREPTMEEILASIRRIISEDDKPAEAAADVLDLKAPPPEPPKAQPAAQPQPSPAAAVAPKPSLQEVFAQEPALEPDDDLIVVENEDDEVEDEAPAFEPPPPQPKARAPQPVARMMDDERLVSEPAAAQAAGALGKLMGSMMVHSGVTLDDVVREMLKPMLKDWLDANLPQLVEVEVQKEIERIRRMAR